LAQPDKSADSPVDMFGKQSIELVLNHIIQAINNTRFNPSFASSATLALNSAEWFFRFVILNRLSH
jgi:nucleoside-specific outer membrane channel protein Tsx